MKTPDMRRDREENDTSAKADLREYVYPVVHQEFGSHGKHNLWV